MKLNFTKLGMMFFLLIGAGSLIGQAINTLTITAPPEVEGNYITTVANGWGAQPTGSVSGAVTFINDGEGTVTDACDGTPADIADWAFIDRGMCDFVTKALAAQAAGAQAVVICNNAPLEGLPPLGFAADGPFAQVTIPVMGISYEDCQRIRVVAETGSVDATAQYFCGVPTYDSSVVWGRNAGEGDFEGGPNGWTVISDDPMATNMDEVSWRWSDTPGVPGSFSAGASIVEGTACNGYMVFPSGFYDNQGTNPAEFMVGTCNVDPLNSVMCNGSLISPNIDLSGIDATGLSCQFYHDWGYYYNGYTSLIVSYDDGVTWPDTTLITVGEPNPIQPEIDFNDGCTPASASVNDRGEGQYSIPIRSYAGEDQIKLQFRHSGGYYFATIDDVVLVEGGFADIEVRRGYFAQSPALAMPASQAQEIPLHVDIFNQGATDAPDVIVKAEAFIGGNATPVFTTLNEQFADQPAFCFLNENFSFLEGYTPPQEIGHHRVLYTNDTPSDAIPANDTLSFGFNLTEDLWATTERTETDIMFDNLITRPAGVDHAIAYPFYIPKGAGQYLNTVTFGVANAATNSGSATVYLYEWNPGALSFPAAIGSGNEYNISPDETNIVGVSGDIPAYGIQGPAIPLVADPVAAGIPIQTQIVVNMAQANPNDGGIDFSPLGELKPIELKDDQQYVLIIAITPADDINVDVLGLNSREGTAYYQTATNAAAFYNGSTRRYTPSVADLFDNGSFAEIDNIIFENGYAAHMPWIEMKISDNPEFGTSVEELTTAADASVSIYPNPVSDFLNIKINLEEVSSVVNVELMDINGQLVKSETYTDVLNGDFKMEVKTLTAGVYTLNVRSEIGFTTRKVVIQD